MDAAAHYRYLAQLGRDEFLNGTAAAALVRSRPSRATDLDEGMMTVDHSPEDFDTPYADPAADVLELFPLVKKPGASFPDRITIGRTSNNDLAFNEHSVSRFHAYLRQDGPGWVVADAGSKNGSWLDGTKLEARRERPVSSRSIVRLGDVELTFFLAADLYATLGGV